MKNFGIISLLCITIIYSGCTTQENSKINYTKKEYRIPMRDGKTLFTAVYTPDDTTKDYPILFDRTPYSVSPYGEDKFRRHIGPSEELENDGYIFALQDVRGKFMSEGNYVNMRPYLVDKKSNEDIDETTDTFDTIDWMVKNIPHNNGNVGMWGISYPGFYTSMGAIDAHPALKAVSPQAPIADWFIGDDMHHNGALTLVLTFDFFASFGIARPELTSDWPPRFKHGTPDGYRFFLDMGPLHNANKKYFNNEIAFWNDAMEHGTYDEFWQSRNILPHFKNITPAVLVVGGWYDAEDLYGAINTYQSIEQKNPDIDNFTIMGPWFHGGWSRSAGDSLGAIGFSSNTSEYYRKEVEYPFFSYYLKGEGEFKPVEARMFDTGANTWHEFDQWPLQNLEEVNLYLQSDNGLSFSKPENNSTQYDEYISDPFHPVPFTQEITNRWTREYMVEDQRFASSRPDVVTYSTPVLDESLTVAGPIEADIYVSTTGTDADWIVKLIDVYPDTMPDPDHNPCKIRMGGYQRLIRFEMMRGKFRNSYEKPEPFIPNKVTRVTFRLNDILHTFKPGHKMIVQIQSSMFPLFDRNPQKFVDIYNAREEDFQKATHRVYHSGKWPSALRFNLLNN
jgi:putative CocE/NonD family hydrolase